ncbi:MAG: GNAT family N-acetyltransferase [Chloroflexota bacterium]
MNQNETKLTILEASLRAVGRQNRAVETLDHFEAYIGTTLDWMQNFAVPCLPNPSDWTSPISALVALFEERKRPLRLEYFHELHPHLAVALESAGFACDRRDPVMALAAEDLLNAHSAQSDGRLLNLEAQDEPQLRSFLRNQSIAYGGAGDESSLGWLPNFISGLKSGDLMVAAIEQEGQLIAGASIQIGGGIGELAGVWTLPAHRRQGHAYALCHYLLRQYFAAGFEQCWLSAAEDAQELYRRLGFVAIGVQLNYSYRSDGSDV